MARQKVDEDLLALFDYNPPLICLSKDSDVTFSYPNMFYDQHLDSRLSLKYIKLVPSLHREISDLVSDELRVLKSKGQDLPLTSNSEDGCRFSTKTSRQNNPPQTTIEDAESVAGFYEKASFYYCASIASTIALHPHAPTWLTILDFDNLSERLRNHPANVDTVVLQVLHHPDTGELDIPPSIWACLDDELRHDIRTISDNGGLAAFQFHAPLIEVEEMFKNMGSVVKKKKVLSSKCSAVDHVFQNDIPLSLDSDSVTTMELLPSIAAAHSTMQETRRSARINHPKKERTSAMPTSNGNKTKTLPILTVKRSNAKKLDSTIFIQRVRTTCIFQTSLISRQAWTGAVKSDATLIIFHCGSYERIGFRHRGSQTLFLSDLIDVSSGSNPAYGKLQIGVYMVILRDALDRIRQFNASANSKSKSIEAKRRRTGDSESAKLKSKRPKTRSATANESKAKEPVEDTPSVCNIFYILLYY